MRAVRIPLFVLLAVLFFILWNAAWVTDRCGEWTAAVDTVTADLDAGGDGGAALGTLDDLWQDVQGYMHIIVSHEDLDEAEALMAQAKALSAQGSTEKLYSPFSVPRHTARSSVSSPRGHTYSVPTQLSARQTGYSTARRPLSQKNRPVPYYAQACFLMSSPPFTPDGSPSARS